MVNISNIVVKYIVLALCILFLVFVVWKLYRDSVAASEELSYWPPEINICPDYWIYDSTDGKCHSGDDTMDPLPTDATDDDLLNACRDAATAGIPWEGVDNLC